VIAAALLAVWLVPLPAASAARPQEAARSSERLDELVALLDRGEEPGWTPAFEALARIGPAAAERVLAGFSEGGFVARRARAKLLARLAAPSLAHSILALVGDPDPAVRHTLLQVLGNPALAEAARSERVTTLVRCAREDGDSSVRAQARSALVECALPEAVAALDTLIEVLPAAEAGAAAEALARLPSGRERLIAHLSEAEELAKPAHVALLAGFGRALAEVPDGGEDPRERRPLLRARQHADPEVRAAAASALASFAARAAELDEGARAERVLGALGDEGWPLLECLRRRIDLAWFERGDAALALELARALQRASLVRPSREGEAWELRARILEGGALAALDRVVEAERCFEGLVRRLGSARGRRDELFPRLGEPFPTAGGGDAAGDRLHLLGITHLWRAYLALGRDEERVLGELRSLHRAFLEARVVAQETRGVDPVALDTLLDRELSPYGLILFNERFAPAARAATLQRALALSRALGRVAPLEMMGLASAPPDPRHGNLFRDPERLALLQALREARRTELQRQFDELGEWPRAREEADRRTRERPLLAESLHIRGALEDEARADAGAPPERTYAQLLEYLAPSLHAHTLAGQLRGENMTSEALELCGRALETLRTAPLGSSAWWNEQASARFELLSGSIWMDIDRPNEAETAYLASASRLASMEAEVEEWRAGLPDPADLEPLLVQLRNQRGEALLALAVNANVRLGDPFKALEYFERAYALNQTPFMRVLRACYRARSGQADEARTVLASVVPVPSLYYNIACTHALLGDTEAALDYLERDVRENCPSAGSLAQKRSWAAKDPDLARLRGEPRFGRLLEGS
jgi:tetratricopeptide (TPR) repeat protein/HEAT repeat protein